MSAMRRPLAICASIAVVASVGGFIAFTTDRDDAPAVVAVGVTRPVDLSSAPAPDPQTASADARIFADSDGHLAKHQGAVSLVLALPPGATRSECNVAANRFDRSGGSPVEVLSAIAKVRDETLRGLLMNEHAAELAVFRSCGSASASDAAVRLADVARAHDAVRRRLVTVRGARR